MDNEDFVRKAWKSLKKDWKDNDSYAPDLFLLDVGDKHFSNADYDKVWAEAAEYTKEVLTEFTQWRAATASIEKLKDKNLDAFDYLTALLQKRFSHLFAKLKNSES